MSEWYFKKNEQKVGPFTNVEMIALYKKKEINDLTLVQKSPHPEWVAFKQTELHQHALNHGNSELKIGNLFSAVFKSTLKRKAKKYLSQGQNIRRLQLVTFPILGLIHGCFLEYS